MPSSLDTVPSAQEWFKTADGCRHFLRVWTANNARAVVLYFHGIEGHSLWFAETAQELCRHGITVYAVDRRGSGKSEENRGDVADGQIFIDDAEQILEQLSKRHGKEAIFLAGGCWGAKIIAALTATKPRTASLLSGLIFSSPAFTIKIDLSLQKKLLLVWRFLTGNLNPLPIPLEPSHFTDNPHYLRFIESDPQRLTEATPRFFVHSQILNWLAAKSASKIDLPVLILQAEHDEIVEIEGLKNWFSRLKGTDKELKIIAGTQHSLDFDEKRSEYRDALSQWILSRSAPPEAAGGKP